jgi:hypothetical protein
MVLFILSLTPHHPNQNRDRTIWRRPKVAPKIEKKQTVKTPMKLKNTITKAESTKPKPNNGLPNTPIVNEGTTMFAASH